MKLLKYVFVFVLFAQSIAQNIPSVLNVKELAVLGKEGKYFVNPLSAKADKDNNLYVFDSGSCNFKMYDKNGKYLNTYGRTGKGPGEYVYILSECINNNDELVIYDFRLNRFTKILKDRKKNETIMPKYSVSGSPVYFSQMQNGNYLVYDLYRLMKKRNVFTIVDEKFDKVIETFGDLKQIYAKETDNLTETVVGEDKLKILKLSKDKILLTPLFYNGKIYSYTNNKGKWEFSTLFGYQPKRKGFLIVEKGKESELLKSKEVIIISSNRGLKEVWQINNMNAGLFIYKNKYILNFIQINEKGGRGKCQVLVDFYNMDGKYLGYRQLYSDKRMLNFSVLCKDNNDDFYIKDKEKDGSYVIKKIRLNF